MPLPFPASVLKAAAVGGLAITALAACGSLPDLGGLAPTARPAPGPVAGVRDGETVLRPGQTLTIALPGNAGTGYAWRLEGFDATVLTRGEPFGAVVATAANRPGGPAETRWAFTAAKRGQTTLIFAYARPWEAGSRPAETARYSVTVR